MAKADRSFFRGSFTEPREGVEWSDWVDWSGCDWPAISRALEHEGVAVLPGALARSACGALAASFEENGLFRSRIDMARHGFGHGEYVYFRYPLPPFVEYLRGFLYERLVSDARAFVEAMGRPDGFSLPATLGEFRRRCEIAGQKHPTPLLLRYRAGDFNCLHRDLYGAVQFPLQAAVLLSEPGDDFEGGEFVLVENRPRQQSRARVVAARRGDVIVFPNHERPVRGARKVLRAGVRHGVSPVTRGERYVLGIIFHDAE